MAKSPAIGRYSASDVARLAGVSSRRIGQWARYGIIPSVSRKPRVYSYADAGEAVLVRYLIEQKLRPSEVRRIVENLRERSGAWPLATAPLEHDGRLVVIHEGDKVYFDAADHAEQKVVAGTLLNLKAVREALAQGGWVTLQHPRSFIEVDPDRLSGRPTIRGRRLATDVVAELAERPEGRTLLRDEYDLSDEEIDDAIGYESDIERALAAAA
jgi:uncharacterized protein (DUF433 family)